MARVHTLGQHLYSTAPQTYNTSGTGTAVDCQGWSALMFYTTVTSGGGGGVTSAVLYESNDNGVADPFTGVGTLFTTAANPVAQGYACSVNLKNRKRFLVAVRTVTGTFLANNCETWELFNQTGVPVVQLNGDNLL